jgi:hypothetical protein
MSGKSYELKNNLSDKGEVRAPFSLAYHYESLRYILIKHAYLTRAMVIRVISQITKSFSHLSSTITFEPIIE